MSHLQKLHARIKRSRLWIHPKNGEERLYIEGFTRRTPKMKANAYLQIVNDRITPFVDVYCENQGEAWADNYKKPIVERMWEQFHELIYDCELERKEVPLHERLRDDVIPIHTNSMFHQAQALRFCCSMKVSALFADTGTGKTKVAIDLAISRYEAGQINKVLIFCPVSTKKNFQDEIDKWYDGENMVWKIVGLETMSSSEKTVLEVMQWTDHETFIIIDESHACKTPFAKRSRRIKACCDKTSYKLIMTGTPAESVKDMYMQYSMLSDLIIGEPNWLKFEEKYLIVDDRKDIVGYKNVDHLMGLVEPYTYQVRKEDVMKLPAKRFHNISCPLTEKQHIIYFRLKEELMEKLENFRDNEIEPPATLIFRYFGKMQQASCGFQKEENGGITDLGTEKFSMLEKTGYETGQTIFFCKYIWEIDRIVGFLGRENCAVFIGDNRTERDAEKDLFTQGRKKYFVATMGSGGTGLNGLQHCNRIIFWSNSFKWMERKQCIGRIDRKGQENEMEIYDLVPDCGIEYRITANLARKGNLANEIKKLLHDKTKLKEYVEAL